MRHVSLGAAMVLALGCGPLEPEIGEEFTLRVGQEAVVADAGVRLVFVEVAGDSRCALQAQCVWAGDATVVVAVGPFAPSAAGLAERDTLHTNLEPKALLEGAAQLTLVRLDPYPETPGSIEREAYEATFVVRIVG